MSSQRKPATSEYRLEDLRLWSISKSVWSKTALCWRGDWKLSGINLYCGVCLCVYGRNVLLLYQFEVPRWLQVDHNMSGSQIHLLKRWPHWGNRHRPWRLIDNYAPSQGSDFPGCVASVFIYLPRNVLSVPHGSEGIR